MPEVELPEASSDFCGLEPIKARSYDTCDMYYKEIGGGANPEDGAYFRFGGSKYLGIKTRKAGKTGDAFSMMHVFGMGDGEVNNMTNAGRIYKGKGDFIIEMKVGDIEYSGIHIVGKREDETKGQVFTYCKDDKSRIQLAISNERVELDSDGKPLGSLTYKNDHDVYGPKCACGE